MICMYMYRATTTKEGPDFFSSDKTSKVASRLLVDPPSRYLTTFEDPQRHKTEQNAKQQGADPDQVAENVLLQGKRAAVRRLAGEFNDQKLNNQNKCKKKQEQVVIKQPLEHISLRTFELFAVDQVEHLHEYKSIEEDSEVSAVRNVPVLFADLSVELLIKDIQRKIRQPEQDKSQNQALKKDLADDVLDHLQREQRVVVLDRASLEQFRVGRLSGERKCREAVHDQVDPEHLHRGQRGLLNNHGADEADQQGDDVDSELELDELANSVVNVPPPQDRRQNRRKVVVKQDDVRGFLRQLRACQVHGEADVGLFQRRRVVASVAGHSHDLLQLHEPGDEQKLVLGRGSCQDPHSFDDLGELANVFDLQFFRVLRAGLQALDPGPEVLARPDQAGEVLGVVVLRQDATLDGDCRRRFSVVAGHHAHCDARPLADRDGFWHPVPDRVLDADYALEDQQVRKGLDAAVLDPGQPGVARVEFAVREAQGPEGLVGVLDDDVAGYFCFQFWAQRKLAAGFIYVKLALVQYGLRGSFHE